MHDFLHDKLLFHHPHQQAYLPTGEELESQFVDSRDGEIGTQHRASRRKLLLELRCVLHLPFHFFQHPTADHLDLLLDLSSRTADFDLKFFIGVVLRH